MTDGQDPSGAPLAAASSAATPTPETPPASSASAATPASAASPVTETSSVPAASPATETSSASSASPASAGRWVPATRTLLWWEIIAVFAVSLGGSGLYALIELIGSLTATRSLGKQTATLNGSLAPGRPTLDLFLQLTNTL